MPYLEGQFRLLIVSALLHCVRKGSHQGKFPDIRMNQSDVVQTWRGTEIQELLMTCIAQAAQRLLLQLMTVTYGFQLRGTLKVTPPCWIMFFVQPQNVVIQLKLYKIGCMMCNFTPDIHGEVHIWHLVRLNVSDTLSSKCSKVVIPWCFGVALCGANICHWWSKKALRWLYDTGMTSSDLYCNHIGRISRGISLNGWQFSPSLCTLCEWVPS